MNLKYKFKVEFTDGTVFFQEKEDVSVIDPKKNAFYDVEQSGKKIRKFTLSRFLERYSVDLITGLFRINGIDVYPEPITDTEGKEKVVQERTLVRYMQVQKRFNATYSTESGNVQGMTELPEDRIFYIGWETEIDGVEYTRVLGVK